ncbi:MAG: glycosyltransferase, partial [bacterium]
MNERFDKNDEWVGKYYLYPNDNNDRISEGGRRTLEQNKEKKDNMPLVSIITVVYNAFETLERTIKSVLNQDYKNIEYIIIDGGSTDGSLDIIKKYEKELEYYISEPDKGIYNAMNKGIALAQGDYICLLNADDYYKPEFVSNSIKKSLETNADIVYSALHWVNEDRYPTKEINEGILLYHMNINHMTFLVSKATYNNIGPYDESNKLFSDDVWIRTSYLKNVRFIYCPKMMVIFGEGGLSSGDNQEKRNNIIKESTGHLVKFFPFLTEEEGEALYLSRFYLNKIRDLLNIYYRYGEREELFRKALSKYIDFALKYRKNYIFDDTKIKKYLPDYMKLAKYLDVPYSAFNFNIPDINIKNIFNKIENIKQSISNKDNNSYTVLHFVSKFSSPSETFIYDLINRLENKTEYNNIVLCDNRILLKERPFKNCIQIDWDNLPVELGYMLYEFLFNELKPDVIIAHFALNGWKLYKRIIPLGIKLPTIHMTHGIDVFSIDKNNEYRKFILDYASIDANTSFTTVSNYLLNELVERGIPEQKINLVPNVIHNRFFENRKTSDFYNGKRTLKLLNVGRLINWKGHDDLLDGLKYFIDNVSDNVSLTIVYANDGRELKNLKDKCKKLNIENKVRFIDFIDFDSEPDYFT